MYDIIIGRNYSHNYCVIERITNLQSGLEKTSAIVQLRRVFRNYTEIKQKLMENLQSKNSTAINTKRSRYIADMII